MNYKNLCLSVLSLFLCQIASADEINKNYPDAIEHVLSGAKKKEERSVKKIEVARRILKNWDAVDKTSYKIDKNATVTILAIVEFLCPHCHDFLSGIKDVDLDKEKINLYVLSLPVFGSDLSVEYGSTMNIAYKLKPEPILEILKHYTFRDIDGFKNQLKTTYDIQIQDDMKKKFSYSDNEKLMNDLEVPSVPLPFLLIDRKEKGKIVVPLPNYNAQEIVKIAHEAEKMEDTTFKNLKKDLQQ